VVQCSRPELLSLAGSYREYTIYSVLTIKSENRMERNHHPRGYGFCARFGTLVVSLSPTSRSLPVLPATSSTNLGRAGRRTNYSIPDV